MKKRFVPVICLGLVLSLLIALLPAGPVKTEKILAESNDSAAVEMEPSDTVAGIGGGYSVAAVTTSTPMPTLAPTPLPPATMPDVVGMNYHEAEEKITNLLKMHGFDKVNYQIAWVQNYDPELTCTVKKQDPEAGKLMYGNHSTATVTLYVCERGVTPSPTNSPAPTPYPAVPMPDVVGMYYQDAQATIKEKLKSPVFDKVDIQIAWVQNYDSSKDCTVLEQDPTAGSSLYGNHSSITVKLIVAERAPTPSPTVAKPAKPTNVKAAAASETSIKITWDTVKGAAGYQISRSTSSTGTFTSLGTVTTNSKVSVSLKPGTTYYYKVRAYKENNGTKVYGAYSAVVSATTKLAKVTGVRAESASATSIKISWSAVSGATGYQVYRSTSSTGTFVSLGTVTTTSKVSTALKTGTKYYYKVRAYKDVNGTKIYGAFSSIVNAVPKPAAPTGVKAVSASSTSIKVSWNKTTGATGYEVFRSTKADSSYVMIQSTTTTSITNKGLTNGKTYYFKIRAYTEVNGTRYYGDYSSVVSAKPQA